MQVTTFVCDVTVPIGSPLSGGWIKSAEVIDDPLLAKGIILRDGGGTYAMVAVDWCLLDGSAYDLFRDRVAAALKIPPVQVAVQTTHPHNAPLVDLRAQDILAKTSKPIVHADVAFVERSADAVAAAAQKAAAGNWSKVTHIGTGKARVEQVASNRRVPLPDGTIGVRFSRTTDPKLRAEPEGLIDPDVRTIGFFDGGKPLVYLHYYATHPQSYYGDGRVTYDFPGIARERLEKETGVRQIYFVGCAGNVTAGKYNDGAPEHRPELAGRLLDGMKRSVAALVRQPAGPLKWTSRVLRLPRRHDAEYDEKALRAVVEDPNAPANMRAIKATRLSRLQSMNSDRTIDLTLLSAGNVRILHLPGEPFVQFQLYAQKLAAEQFVAVAGYGDDFTGYLCTAESYKEGGYEPTATVLAPMSEQYVRAGIADLLTGPAPRPRLLRVQRIWNAASHCAFTDLVRYHDQWFCTFREGPKHVSEEASIRIIRSQDGEQWESAALISEAGSDLRDPKLSITPDDRLMLLGGVRKWPPKYERSLQSWVAFSQDGTTFTPIRRVGKEGEWLWRVTWFGGAAYGFSYGGETQDKLSPEWYSRLCKASDGIAYEQVCATKGWPGLTEATIRFDEQGTMYCVHRRDAGTNTALLGTSKPPYTDWIWRDTGFHLGGPELIRWHDQWWVAGRWVVGKAATVLARADFERGTIEPVIELPSGGDTSYPGMVVLRDQLWMTYYSSHEGSTAVYFSRFAP